MLLILLSYKFSLLLAVFLLSGKTGKQVAADGAVSRVPTVREMVVKEGSSTLLECNVTGARDDIQWFNSKGALLDEDAGGKWKIEEKGVLNITVVSFEDRGRYTCVASGTAGSANYTVNLRVAHTDSGLGLYYVIVCLVAFTITMILNVARLCMTLTPSFLYLKHERQKLVMRHL
uniref:Microfibril-associated glycoprotein 3 n=1 Tax=Myripristis murdjan TaxID=586833 RepID=A0A667YTC4_9TELE